VLDIDLKKQVLNQLLDLGRLLGQDDVVLLQVDDRYVARLWPAG
jgi:hypothetical protein